MRYGVAAVQGYIDLALEQHIHLVAGEEGELYPFYAVMLHGIGNEVLVQGGGAIGNRAQELVGYYVDVILVDVNVLIHVLHEGIEAGIVYKVAEVYALIAGYNGLFLFGVLAVVYLLGLFLYVPGQQGLARQGGGVQVVGHELELAEQDVLLQLLGGIAEREHHFLILVVLYKVVGGKAVAVAVGHYQVYEGNGRVVLIVVVGFFLALR